MQPENSGYYYCVARNAYGDDRCWVYLDIRPANSGSSVSNNNAPQADIQYQPQQPQQSQQPQPQSSVTTSGNLTPSSSLTVKINGTLPRSLDDLLELAFPIGNL